MTNQNKILELLQEAKDKIKEAGALIPGLEISVKVGGDYVVTEEFELALRDLAEVREAVQEITNKGVIEGNLDVIENKTKELLKEFFKTQYKQKKYEGAYMEMGYTRVERKVIDGKPDDKFVTLKPQPNTKAIDEYRKGTVTSENPDGKLPTGIGLNSFEYIKYKKISNGEN